ncbi:MAG: rhomboid family intramembrane serine protease [Bacteroidales bacterium]|nr:rhomboid family intramembrane serine protease [Bacteroidales bacterium]
MNETKTEKYRIISGLVFPILFVVLIWGIKFYEHSTGTDLTFLGLYPLNPKGLTGILTGPLIHADWKHLANNSLPLIFFGWTIAYFYRNIALKVFFLIYLLSQLWLWFFYVRPAWHIGASGVIYGMGAFVFVSGIIRRNRNLLAISLLVAFLYGSMVWGIFPYEEQVSWEGHLMGLIAGIILAYYYKDYGPEKPTELIEDDELNDEDDFWNDYSDDTENSYGESDNTGKNHTEK